MASEQMTLREVCLAERYEEEMTAKDKRIAELEAALRELANACISEFGDGTDTNEPDDGSVYVGYPDGTGITFGMLRRARAALSSWEGRSEHPDCVD